MKDDGAVSQIKNCSVFRRRRGSASATTDEVNTRRVNISKESVLECKRTTSFQLNVRKLSSYRLTKVVLSRFRVAMSDSNNVVGHEQ